MRHSRHGLDFEDGLRLGGKCHGRLERVLDAMAAQELKKIGRVLVHDDVCLGNVDSEAVREELFPLLRR